MSIRPIDFQNILARVNTIAKRASHIISAKKSEEESQNKKLHDKNYNKDKKVTKTEKLSPDENKLLKILYDRDSNKHHREHTYNKKKKKLYDENDDEDHIIDEKI